MPNKGKKVVSPEKLEKFSHWANALLQAMVSMHGELELMAANLNTSTSSWEKQLEGYEERISTVENFRKKELRVSKDQLKKIELMEENGFSLTDKTILAHILGTNQLVAEDLGKIGKTLDVLDEHQRNTVNHMVALDTAIQLQGAILSDIKDENEMTRKEFIKLILRMTKVLILAIAGLVALIGMDRIWDWIRLGGI